MKQLQPLPSALYRAQQSREIDRIVIEEHGVAGFELMRRAAKAAFDTLLATWYCPAEITVFCGSGNNAGDGYLLAVLAKQQGIPVRIVQVGNTERLTGDAHLAWQQAQQAAVPFVPFANSMMNELTTGVIVDALLGTGLKGKLRGDYPAAIAAINASGLPVLAVDIPSGLCSDTGCALSDSAVRAEITVTFIVLKQGLLTADGPSYVGHLQLANLGLPMAATEGLPASSERLNGSNGVNTYLPKRPRNSHKGDYGHVLVVGGNHGMAGAVMIAAQAALRVGAGLVSCATQPDHVSAVVARCPEVMAHGVTSKQAVEQLRASVVVIGPGLGQKAWSEQLLYAILAPDSLFTGQPFVVDADALTLLSQQKIIRKPYCDHWILTPHPGEAACLLGCSSADIQNDRFAAVTEIQRRYGGVTILKGAGTLVADGKSVPALCPYGNPGMAAAGMGDCLSGVLGALLAQGLSVAQAARLGVCLHSRAGDLAAQQGGERGTCATDLLPFLRQLVNDSSLLNG